MIGLFFLATVALWLAACLWLANRLGNLIPAQRWRLPAKLAILLALLSAPFVDEVIGNRQFQALCKANGIESADVSKARGRKVKVEYGERKLVDGTVLPIKEDEVLFRDAESGEVLIRHKNYYASGGWLMRHTWLSMGSDDPMLFDGNCIDFVARKAIFSENRITQQN